MNYKMMGRLIGLIMALEAAFMLPAWILCMADGDWLDARSFLLTIVLTAAIAGALLLLCRKRRRGFYARDGLVCVGLCWAVISLMGCLPFFFSGSIPYFIDALFEIVSGFTTTGASVLARVEDLSRGMLYWRSFSHWLGGMGVLVLLLAVAPVSGRSEGFTINLLRAESPGPNVGKLVPRMRKTAKILYIIYVSLTLMDIAFLLAGGMPMFDAVCTAFGTAGTGGFGIKSDSIASYSPYLQNVCTVFMLLFGVNFSCFYLLLMREFRAVFRDEELKMYIGVALSAVALIVVNLRNFYPTISETIRHAFFQVASIMTTTGFATTDFDLWPAFSKAVLLCLMVVGACAGSTGGGMKCGRVILIIKALKRNILQALHPNKVVVVRMNKRPIDEKVLDNAMAYLAAYFIIVFASFILISTNGFSMTTSFSAVLACFNNIGPGLELVGPLQNYMSFNAFSKSVLIFDMLAGRLEIFPILVLFSKSTWRRR